MAYTDQQIRDFAATLDAKGAASSEIEDFVRTAKGEQSGSPQVQAMNAAQAPAEDAPVNPQVDALQKQAMMALNKGDYSAYGEATTQLDKIARPQLYPKDLGGAAQDMFMRGAGPAAGQAIGAIPAIAGPTMGLSIPIGGAIGGSVGDYKAQQRAIDAGEQPEGFKVGQNMGAAISGAIPAFAGKFLSSALKYTASNLAAQEVAKQVDTGQNLNPYDVASIAASSAVGAKAMQLLGKQPTSLEDPLWKQRNAAFQAVRPNGVKVPPAELGKGSSMLSSAAGPTALARDAAVDTGRALQTMAQEDLGISKAGDLSILPSDFNKVRVDAGKVYGEVAKISPTVATAVETLPLTRSIANNAYDSFKAGKITYQEWQAAQKEFTDQKDAILQAAAQSSPGLAQRLKDAEVTIAKSYAYQRGANPTTGLIDPQSLGAQAYDQVRDGGKIQFTGNAAKIADFANAFPRIARSPESVMPSSPNSLNQSLALMSLSSEKPEGLLMGAKNALAKPLRNAMLSNVAQNQLAKTPMTSRSNDFLANFGRFLSQSAGTPQTQPDVSQFLPQGTP